MTAAERAREIVDEAFREWTPRPMSALDAKEHFYQAVITRLTRALLAHEAEVRNECAKIAGREGCNDRGCWTTETHNEHSLQCPIGIGRAIRDSGREKERG